MITFFSTKNGRRVSNIATKKEIIYYLKEHYALSNKRIESLFSEARENNWIWNDFLAYGECIVIYMQPRKMWIGIANAQESLYFKHDETQ